MPNKAGLDRIHRIDKMGKTPANIGNSSILSIPDLFGSSVYFEVCELYYFAGKKMGAKKYFCYSTNFEG